MRKEGYSMIFDGHSDIFSDVRYKREAGETQVSSRIWICVRVSNTLTL